MTLPERPISVLIAALGGEGGGVLADWIVAAATARDYPVQSTSIPGVAQRTGATTYYVEIYPVAAASLGGRAPVLALTPTPGDVDVVMTSELLEAGRALQSGYVTPGRTTLIASTHRVYTVGEKTHMAEGRFGGERVLAAARLAKRAVLFDMQRLAQQHGTMINAVLFGALVGSRVLPLAREDGEAAIRSVGKGAEQNLKGFALGCEHAVGADQAIAAALERRLPAPVQAILEAGVARCSDFQDATYARRYLARLKKIEALDRDPELRLTQATGRYLALWMCYEDVIRVADLKIRASRLARVREEVGAKPDEPVRVTEFMKPGIEEVAAILPRPLSGALRRWAEKRRLVEKLNVGMHVRTTSVTGFMLLRLLAAMRPLRRFTARWHEEQALIERWLRSVGDVAERDSALALEVAELGRLIKGYGETHRRGKSNFLLILEMLVEGNPTLAASERAAAIRAAREAALADSEGQALAKTLEARGIAPAMSVKPVKFTPRPRSEEKQRTPSDARR